MNHKTIFYRVYRWLSQIFDPVRFVCGVIGYFWFVSDAVSYKKMDRSNDLRLSDMQPELHDRYFKHGLDTHYFYVNAWAMRSIIANRPGRHYDIGSLIVFPSMLSAVVPVEFLDYRPLQVELANLKCVSGNILQLPHSNNSIESLSCLHVAEHIGLGRYGDALDPEGTVKAIIELKRILAVNGHLYFALPVGKTKLCFNAHRIHSPSQILDYFEGLKLLNFAAVNDNGLFEDRANPTAYENADYACGMFHFTKE